MEFALTDRCQALREQLLAFMDEHVYAAEQVYHEQIAESGQPHFHPPVMEELKARARDQGLWNLWLPHDTEGHSSPGLTNVEYASLAEIKGRSHIAPEAFEVEKKRGSIPPKSFSSDMRCSKTLPTMPRHPIKPTRSIKSPLKSSALLF